MGGLASTFIVLCTVLLVLLQNWKGARGERRGTVLTWCWCLLDVADSLMLSLSLTESFGVLLGTPTGSLQMQFPYTGNFSMAGCKRLSLCHDLQVLPANALLNLNNLRPATFQRSSGHGKLTHLAVPDCKYRSFPTCFFNSLN